jgi:hypothetical protein
MPVLQLRGLCGLRVDFREEEPFGGIARMIFVWRRTFRADIPQCGGVIGVCLANKWLQIVWQK